MRIPDNLLDCVVFLGQQEEKRIEYRGTGFFVIVEHEESNTKWRFAYLVTAKHTAQKVSSSLFYVRTNLRTGKAADIEMNAPAQIARWYTNEKDPDADVAITPVVIQEQFNHVGIGIELVVDEEERNALSIGVGDEVFMIGLFGYLKGASRNIPICRTGNIAMYPDQKVVARDPSGNKREIEAFLVEARSIGGISGSPVFARHTTALDGIRDSKTHQPTRMIAYSNAIHLVGLASAHWDIDPSDINSSNPKIASAGVNIGLATVTPSYKIREILEGKELSLLRKEGIAKYLSQGELGVAVFD